MDQLDSALKVSQEADQFANTHGHARFWNAVPAGNLGKTYLMMGDIKKAEEHFVYALEESLFNKNQMHLTPNFNGLGKVYLEIGDFNKALQYSSQAIANALLINVQPEELATGYLTKSEAFNKLNDLDSAYHYLTLARNLKDSLQQIKLDNITRFNVALLDENIRNRDLEREKINAF